MCGIVVYVNPMVNLNEAIAKFENGKARGPESTSLQVIDNSTWMGFHRLAINGVDDPAAEQPMHHNNLVLVCNGEIYNSQELYAAMGVVPKSGSDCEVILHLFERYCIDQTVHMIDASEFAFVLYNTLTNEIYAARDPYGVRPLYVARFNAMLVFASELKSMMWENATFEAVQPGTISRFENGVWSTRAYHTLPHINHWVLHEDPVCVIQRSLYEAVLKRVKNTARPMACLLSGGLDSSIITALVSKCRRELGMDEPLETYSIGMEGGEDLRYASLMAEHVGTKHTTVVVGEESFFEAIPTVIYAIESYDTTTVRASVGNYLVANYISNNSEAKVLFNGDGADEVAGGYLYFRAAPDPIAADAECRRLLTDIHAFDVRRSDGSISSNGLEARTPFLDRQFVQAYLSLPPHVRFPPNVQEKHLLRMAFGHLLPPEIANRTKEAFSDGVSSVNNSWFEIIRNRIPTPVQNEFNNFVWSRKAWLNPPKTPEQYYYRSIYDEHFAGAANTIPYFWMPKFVVANDASARTLSFK